jgi:DNA-binding NtrC family response regulator
MATDAGRVLVVDDLPEMLSLLHDILAPLHDVVVAPDGNVAFFKLETEPFDVVLTDVRMPGPDGFEVARLIKSKWPLTEVVLMTAFASIPAAVEAVRLGAYDYIAKPFGPDDVTLAVTRALERRRARVRLQDAEAAGEQLARYSYREALTEAQDRGSREYLVALLRACAGNVSRAAERAGLERESLHRLLRRHGIQADAFRSGTFKIPGSES